MLDMSLDKEFVYVGDGVLERIKEDTHKPIKPLTEEDFIKFIKDRFNEIVKPSPMIVISNGLTKEQIEYIKNYYSNL